MIAAWQGVGSGHIAGLSLDNGSSLSGFNIDLADTDNTGNPAVQSVSNTGRSATDIQSTEYPQNVPSFKFRWTADNIEGFSRTGNDVPVIVAVLDTGIDKNHEELVGRIASEINLSGENSIDDICGHGTSIAGIIAADAENQLGIAGVAPESQLLNIKVADDNGKCRILALSEGIIWAVDHGAKVINVSIEFKESVPGLKEAVDYAWDKGAIVIAAAGNDGNSQGVYPAYYDNCLAVTAIKENGELAPLANYGDWVDVAAPGYKVYTLSPGNGYRYVYGTSFSAAYVSGLAASLFSIVTDTDGDGRLNDEVREAIETGCIHIDSMK